MSRIQMHLYGINWRLVFSLVSILSFVLVGSAGADSDPSPS
jgi:hypothetical protein